MTDDNKQPIGAAFPEELSRILAEVVRMSKISKKTISIQKIANESITELVDHYNTDGELPQSPYTYVPQNRTYKTAQKTVFIEKPVYVNLKGLASRVDMNLAELMRLAISDYLRRYYMSVWNDVRTSKIRSAETSKIPQVETADRVKAPVSTMESELRTAYRILKKYGITSVNLEGVNIDG